MSEENWYKLDNVAKVFLATHNARDTRTLRVCCTLTEEVNPDLLQQALLSVIQSRRLFQVRIRRGLFWHYMEPCNALPQVREEHERPCPSLYDSNRKELLHYSVTYYHKRINLEVFHALTDGTGALEFLNVLVAKYLKLAHPEELRDYMANSVGSLAELEENSYEQFYEKNGKVEEAEAEEEKPEEKQPKNAYHIRGGKLPYDQLQFFEISMESAPVKAAAKADGVGLSGMIGARLMMALYQDMPVLTRRNKVPISISMPVNLRNYYPSETSRNFFISIVISHVFTGNETEAELAQEFEQQMKRKLKPAAIRRAMNQNQQYEELAFVRVVPLAIKQIYIRHRARLNNRKCSAVISNLGILRTPEELKPYIDGYAALCSHDELFMTVYSYSDKLCFGITSGYRNTAVLKNFVRTFSSEEHPVDMKATEVTLI